MPGIHGGCVHPLNRPGLGLDLPLAAFERTDPTVRQSET